jgi:DNA-binding response OmpR family regulator
MTEENRHGRGEMIPSPHRHDRGDTSILVASTLPEVRRVLETDPEINNTNLLFASTGDEALQLFDRCSPKLVLLDVELPGIPSWQVCEHLLEKTRIPIVFLAASHRADDAIRALSAGAVDYVARTVPPQILLARARAALRRNDAFIPQPSSVAFKDRYFYNDEYLQVDLAAQEVLVEGKPVGLTTIEYNLFVYLLTMRDKTCSKDQILRQIWGAGYETSLHYVHLYISRLRRKIEQAPNDPTYLISVYGQGYRFQPNGAHSM